MKRLTEPQRRALALLRRKWAYALGPHLDAERNRFGFISARDLETQLRTDGLLVHTGRLCESPLTAPRATWFALADAGLITLRTKVDEYSDLRRGAFGRWIGGTVKRSEVTYYAIPTDGDQTA